VPLLLLIVIILCVVFAGPLLAAALALFLALTLFLVATWKIIAIAIAILAGFAIFGDLPNSPLFKHFGKSPVPTNLTAKKFCDHCYYFKLVSGFKKGKCAECAASGTR
jgi:hypothetical protein